MERQRAREKLQEAKTDIHYLKNVVLKLYETGTSPATSSHCAYHLSGDIAGKACSDTHAALVCAAVLWEDVLQVLAYNNVCSEPPVSRQRGYGVRCR